MGTQENVFSELLELVKSWFPHRSEPAYVSRDFWMPDNSCRVCYDCDVQFSIFVRKHHCRLCGRVFCKKCTANFIPVPSADPKNRKSERDRVRVCNFCFQQWQQEVDAAANAIRTSNSGMDHSFSTASIYSTRSSSTLKSSTMTACSMSYSNEPYQPVVYVSAPGLVQSEIIDPSGNIQDILMLGMNVDSAGNVGHSCSNQSSFSDKSDFYNDAYGVCHSDSETHHFQHCDDYYGHAAFDEIDQEYERNELNHTEKNLASEVDCSPVGDSTKSQDSTFSDKVAEVGPEHGNDYSVSSSIYGMEGTIEPVDFENNGLLWLPPEPEDEEDENEAVPIVNEDEYATGECGYLHFSKSFNNGEFRTRDRSSEEHKKTMKNVVGGHFRALIAEFLQVENLPIGEEGDKESWLEIITSLSWEAATLLKPDTSRGGGMDPGGYVKVKCIACGHRSQSVVIRGVVCKKNIAHRHMMSSIEKPHLLILGGALEYQRVMNSLSSFDTLLQQETDHLKMAVARIDSQHPHVLLVEKSVSHFARDYLLAKNISVVLNIKRPLLERISRCTGAQIVPSIDHLSSLRLGHCDLFHVEKFFEEHGSAGQNGKKMMKTLMFFEECPRPLGCTILLKGANGDELKKVKHVVQYGVFAAYHLALETSFLADEGASLPELPLKSPITVALPDKPSCISRSISTIPGCASNASDTTLPCNGVNDNNVQYTSKITKPEKGELHVLDSSAVSCQTAEVSSSFSSQAGDNEKMHMCSFSQAICIDGPQSRASSIVKDCIPTFSNDLIGQFSNDPIAGMISNDVQDHSIFNTVDLKDELKKENQIGPTSVLNPYQDSVEMQESTQTNEDLSPSPSDHQSILVSLSSRCVWKGTVCERSHLFRIKYYGSFDKPLGRFLRDHLFDQFYRCPSCDMPSEAHIQCYTHQQGSLTISVRKLPEFYLHGERDGRIWMWHRCLQCPRVNGFPPATRRIVMSDAAWGLSFGKFLELSFSNHAAASRVASCGHSLHRDCLRFYGFGKMVACFRYASINVHSVCLPPHKLNFNYEYQDWILEEANKVNDSKELLFAEVLSSLKLIAVKKPCCEVKTKSPEFNYYIHKLEEMQQKEKEEFEESLNKALKKELKKGEPVIDILEINQLKRQLVFQSYLWDQRLICATGSEYRPHVFLSSFLIADNESFPPMEKLGDLNVASSFASADSDSRIDDTIEDRNLEISHSDDPFDHSNIWDLYQHKTVAEVETLDEKENKTSLSTCVSEAAQLDSPFSGLIERRAISDGQFPDLENISDTFDAKWRGENGTVFSNLSTLDSSVLVDSAVMAALEDTEEKGIADVTETLASIYLSKLGDSTEEFTSWIGLPFLKLYQSFNKCLDNTPRFGALNEYNPVYVSLFWELEHQGGGNLLLPIGENGVVIPVYDVEPTSVICYALVSADYYFQVLDDREKTKDFFDSSLQSAIGGSVNLQFSHSIDELSSEVFKSFGSTEESILSLSGSRTCSLDPALYTKTMHARITFEDDGPLGKLKYTVICYFAKHFDSLRRTCCPSELDFIRSLSRCKKWGAQGGKSNALFAKSLDDRLIIKQVTKTEIESFIKFAPEYFKYLSESIASRSPTCLAKILGIFQVTTKHLKGGKVTKIDVLVMENLLFGRTITRLYDLKGSLRSRYNPDSNGNNKVLLDQNLIEAMPKSPIFVDGKAKRLLERAVWNDTSFLASVDVMDYSLLVGVDEIKNELVLGIIDFMRQYTWDKHLETWVKASGILGGPKNVSPTVISPKQYKKRFRKAMSAYFLVVPDQWSFPPTAPTNLESDIDEFDTNQT